MVPQDSGHRPDLRTDAGTGPTTGIESTTAVDAGPSSLARVSRDEFARRVAGVRADAVVGEPALPRSGGDEEPAQ
ncbi:hypothetical protein [Streptomyces lydicus]|uniref:hypothetical protein n=1 Tax=Streptomyces lydicus TaxID=47763 RepID=UPI00287059A3|nr:hypothetical protein [Streptomyces lydicus]